MNSQGGVVVDTNVAIVANGRDTHADDECQLTCVNALAEIYDNRPVVLDHGDLIMDEYAKYLHRSGEPGAGDAFYKYLCLHSHTPGYVHRVSLTPIQDERRGFAELPANNLDPGDRKFLAVAFVAKAPIMNATDSDWHEQRSFLEDHDLVVEQLCPQHAIKSATGM